MNFTGLLVRYFTTKTTVASRVFSRNQFPHRTYISLLLQATDNQTMSHRAYSSDTSSGPTTAKPSHPYHTHRVTVSQESIQTKGRRIEFEISVIDTHPGESDKPTVVGLHGIPGSGMDFEPCIQLLAGANVRFIGPTFPGFEGSEIESWKLYHVDYTSPGCASMVLQVLDHLHIDRVDMLMGHSAGGWVSYKLAAESDRVKSLCLLNPCGARPHQALRPQFVIHSVAWLLRIQSLHFILMPMLEFFYSFLGFKGVKGGDHLMAAQQIVSGPDFDQTRKSAEEIHRKRLPLLFAYTLNDKIVERAVYEEMLFQHLAVPRSAVTRVDAEKKQTALCDSSVDQEADKLRVAVALQCERGGHVVHKAHTDLIMDRVMHILRSVKN